MRNIFMIILMGLVLLFALSGCSGNVEESISGKSLNADSDDASLCMIDDECDDDKIQSEITGNAIKTNDSNNPIVVYFFWGDGCPHCAEQKTFLDSLKQKYPTIEVKMFETWYNRENAERFQQMAESFGTSVQGVPTTFIGDKYWVGFADYMKSEMEDYVDYCLDNGCPN